MIFNGPESIEKVNKYILYTMEDADGIIRNIIPYHYDVRTTLCDGIDIRFTDIGHLLGSASIEVWATEGDVTKKIVFSGDIGNKDQPLIKDPTITKDADYVVMEATYGTRLHSTEKPDYIKDLANILQETFDKGGNVVIPSFAVGAKSSKTSYQFFSILKPSVDKATSKCSGIGAQITNLLLYSSDKSILYE